MANNRPFIPGFIQKLDASLLLKNPSVWSARTHFVFLFFLPVAFATIALTAYFFRDARANHGIESFTACMIIISLISAVIWMVYLLRFNVFKRFGKLSFLDGLITYILYFVNFALIMLLPFIPAVVQQYQANKQFSDDEIASDVNHMNKMLVQLERKQIPTDFVIEQFILTDDSIKLFNNSNYTEPVAVQAADTAAVFAEQQYGYNGDRFTYFSSETLDEFRMANDSLVQINDSVFKKYNYPNLQFVSSNQYYENNFYGQSLTNRALYEYMRDVPASKRASLLDSVKFYKTKYADVDGQFYNYYENQQNYGGDFHEKIKRSYTLNTPNDVISTVVRRKNELKNDLEIVVRVWYYPALILSILVFVFRHTTRKTFFLSILVGVIIAIITGLIIGLSNGEEITVFTLFIAYCILFGVIAFLGLLAKRRQFIFGMATGFFMVMLPFMPLIVRMYQIEKASWFDSNVTYANLSYHYELAGFVLLLILVQPVFRFLFRRWYALPQE